jgi:hypothetical protein
MNIPGQFITVDYLLDPATENILFTGDELKEGMVVLIEGTIHRSYNGEPLPNLTPHQRRDILTCARWCKIETLAVRGGYARFIGIYADGSKCVRVYPSYESWIVKLDSIPAT